MLDLYDKVCSECSKNTTKRYSTSFSLGIYLLNPSIRPAIYSIYGMVRFADEIVDTFHDYDKKDLLNDFRSECFNAIERGLSTNPILHAYQQVVNEYNIPHELIHSFFDSMEMDLDIHAHDKKSMEDYIVGSAEVVGLMCLCVFLDGDKEEYERLRYPAERLGAAFQKVNFLRDLSFDQNSLGRTYFPQLVNGWNSTSKLEIEADIKKDFDDAYEGIKQLPKKARLGVYLAYKYYLSLFQKITNKSPENVLTRRIRISNGRKLGIMLRSYTAYNLQMIQ